MPSYLDTRLGIDFGISVSGDMRSTVDHACLEAELAGCALCHGGAEKAGADDYQVERLDLHRQVPSLSRKTNDRDRSTGRGLEDPGSGIRLSIADGFLWSSITVAVCDRKGFGFRTNSKATPNGRRP